jgi:hypothetical protein
MHKTGRRNIQGNNANSQAPTRNATRKTPGLRQHYVGGVYPSNKR